MKLKYWLVFGFIQTTGAMVAYCAYFLIFPTLLLLAWLLLLPGSLAWAAIFRPGQVGADWSPWTLGAIAVLANVLLFATASFLLAKYRKSK